MIGEQLFNFGVQSGIITSGLFQKGRTLFGGVFQDLIKEFAAGAKLVEVRDGLVFDGAPVEAERTIATSADSI